MEQPLIQQGDKVYFSYRRHLYEGEYRGRCHGKSIVITEDGKRWYIVHEKVFPKHKTWIAFSTLE